MASIPSLGLFHPWPEPDFSHETRLGARILRKIKYFFWYRANPRDRAYMEALFCDHFPQGEFVDVSQTPSWTQLIQRTDHIVLLYPDAIGHPFSAIEKTIQKKKKPSTGVEILNGRKRLFLWNRSTRWALKWRRMLEYTPIFEIIALIIFIVITPFLWLWDRQRGHR
ncbi:hypothetical protein ACQZV8_18465 [Magnetococcales bacterium HHB-1]